MLARRNVLERLTMAHVMTLNAGSSSIKFALFTADHSEPEALAMGIVDMHGEARHLRVRGPDGEVTHQEDWTRAGTEFHEEALRRVLAWRRAAFPNADVIAAGHRVVHG